LEPRPVLEPGVPYEDAVHLRLLSRRNTPRGVFAREGDKLI
jgi:hypothetical protein